MTKQALINNLATLENAKAWQADSEKFVFCIDLLDISANHRMSDTLVYDLEERFEELLEAEN